MLKQLKEKDPEHNSFQNLERVLKYSFYQLMNEVLSSNVLTPFFYKLLLLIEAAQLSYFSITAQLPYVWDTKFLDFGRQLIRYFQISYLLHEGSDVFFIGCLYVSFSILLLMLILIIIICKKLIDEKQQKSSFVTYSIKIIAIFIVFTNTILFIPFYQISLQTMYCKSDSTIYEGKTCYEGIYFLHLFVGIICFLMMIFFTALIIAFFIERNPNSKLPFATLNILPNIFKFLIKLFMPVYLSIDSTSEFTKEFIVVITLAYLLLIILRYFSAPYYHRNIYNLVIMYEIFCFWISLSVLLHCFLDNGPIDNMGFVFFVVGTPIILKMGVEVFKNKDFSLLNKTYKDIKKDSEFMNYFIVLFDYIEKIEQNYYRIILEGVLRYHNKNCKRTDKCQCQSLLNEKENPNNIQFKWFKFLQQLTEESIEKCPKSNKLLLFHSFLQHDNLENKYKSLYELEKIKDPSLQEQFCIFRYTIIIEEQIIDQDQKSAENQGVDINAIIIFQNEYVKFQDLIESSIVIYLDFWKELIEDNPDIQKLQQLGTEINTKNEQIYNDFLDLSDRNPNHLGALKLYGFYLKSVQNEDKEALLIIEKMFYVMKSVQMNKQFIDNEKVRYDDTSNTTIITISGNKDEMALVKNCNKELEKVLGFHKSYIMDQNISKLMPKIFGEIHNNFVSQFIQSSKEKVIGKSRSVFAEESHGYLVPCKLMIKVFPSLQEGVQIVGFLTKKVFKQIEKQGAAGSNNQHYLIYNVKTYTVAGITKNCYDNYGIPAGLMYGNGANQNEITIDQIFRDLEKQENQDSLMSPQGLITTLDTTEIPRNFLLEDDIDKFGSSQNQSQSYPEENQQLINQDGDSIDQQQMNQINEYHQQQENMMNEQNKKQSKYKKVQARVFLESEDTYDNDHVIRVIRFYEVDDQGTNIHENKIKQNSQNKKKAEQKIDHRKQNNTIIEEVEENYQNEMTENQNESIAQSVQQDADQIHDDARNLKEFKQLISEKNVPRQITVLKYLMFFLFIIIISLGVIFQQYARYQNSDLKKGVLSVYSSYQRLYQISEVNFLSRQMSMIANEYITVSDIEKSFKNQQPNLSDAVDNLQSTNFDVTQYDQDVDRSSKNKEYTVYNQLQNGNIKNYEYTFSEAIVSLITSAGTLTNTSYTNFQYEAEIVDGTFIDYDQLRDDGNTVFIDNIQRYYYMVMKNGLFKLRNGARIAADEFYDYYYDRLSTYNTSILIIIIVACVVTLGSQIIILPIVFKIYQTNNQVVSLFGNIPIHEIQYLIFKCEFYTDIFFKDQVTGEDDQDGIQNIELNNEQQNQNNDQQLDNNKTPQGINMTNDNSFQQNQHENSHSQMINNQNNTTTFNTFFNIQDQIKQFLQDKDQEVNFNIIKQNDAICRHKLKELKKIKEEQEKDQEIEVQEQERAEKLRNSKDNNKKIVVIFQFLGFCIIFMSYFIISYIIEKQFLDNMKMTYNFFKLQALRPVFIQYNIIFTIEEIILGKVQSDDISDDLQDYYLDQVYDNEGDLLEAYSQYPNDYDSFITQFKSFSQSSLCKVSTYGGKNQSDCEDISLGILKSGLRTANIALIENNRNLISNFRATDKEKTDKIDMLNSEAYTNILQLKKYLIPAMEELIEDFLSTIKNYIDGQNTIELIKVIIFIVIIVLVFFIFWRPYQIGLNTKIWRSKGMLNMIPMDIIMRHPKLRQNLQNGDIVKAVK